MSSTTLHQFISNKQAKVGEEMKKRMPFLVLIHNLIREYGVPTRDGFDVDIYKFSQADRKLLISYLEAPEWYEWACESKERIDGLFLEHAKYIQEEINNESWAVYCDAMEEMGARCVRHPDNDEVYWVR